MSQWILCCSLLVITWTFTLFGVADSVIYTSSKKIEDMVLQEERILNDLQRAVNELGNETVTSSFNRFYHQRMPRVKERRHDENLRGNLRHPNGIYHSLKQFATEYENIRATLKFSPSTLIHQRMSSIAAMEDIKGARLSFLRLQDVYNLNISDMMKGNYLGFVGPELSDQDMLEIGEAAFNDNQLEYAIAWLQEVLKLTEPKEPTAGFLNPEGTGASRGRVLSLIGRTYLRQGNKDMGAEMYRKARSAGGTDEHITKLERELEFQEEIEQPAVAPPHSGHEKLLELCPLQNKLTLKTFDPRLTCSYKEVILPYYRFKQELVSVSPYVALFYEVITDQEIDTIRNTSEKTLCRGLIERDGKQILLEIRTSHTTFIHDWESPLLANLSKRIGAITDLNTNEYEPDRDLGGEPYQVVNYGMGGHYNFHLDYFDTTSIANNAELPLFKHGGNRLATFLIYLTDVERGGSTVFDTVDLAVSPVKKMALFWYGYKPSGELDRDTNHAGCPVVYGHKWVANKWIWHHGNTFTRRCGLTPDATQLDIEPYMRNGWV